MLSAAVDASCLSVLIPPVYAMDVRILACLGAGAASAAAGALRGERSLARRSMLACLDRCFLLSAPGRRESAAMTSDPNTEELSEPSESEDDQYDIEQSHAESSRRMDEREIAM